MRETSWVFQEHFAFLYNVSAFSEINLSHCNETTLLGWFQQKWSASSFSHFQKPEGKRGHAVWMAFHYNITLAIRPTHPLNKIYAVI